jgi:hypothetical protein
MPALCFPLAFFTLTFFFAFGQPVALIFVLSLTFAPFYGGLGHTVGGRADGCHAVPSF